MVLFVELEDRVVFELNVGRVMSIAGEERSSIIWIGNGNYVNRVDRVYLWYHIVTCLRNFAEGAHTVH